MGNRKPLTDAEGEVRELTAEDFREMVPFSALPASLQDKLNLSGCLKSAVFNTHNDTATEQSKGSHRKPCKPDDVHR